MALPENVLWAYAAQHYVGRTVVEARLGEGAAYCPRCGNTGPTAVFVFEGLHHHAEGRCGHCLNQHLGWMRKPGNAGKRQGLAPGLRFSILQAAGFRCAYCGRHRDQLAAGEFLHVDHRVPVAAGGKGDRRNLVCACSACNLGKSARQLELIASEA